MTTKTIQMYRTNLDGSETTLYPLTEAKYVTMDDGTTIEEALTNSDSSKYSPVIESSKAMFKVGEGDSVDLSESAIDGAYNSCVLKGKTMVNCIQEPSSQDVVLPYEFADGQYVTINDTKESGALGVELKGQTLVNIHKLNTPSLAAQATGWYENLVTNSGEIGFDVLTSPEGWRYISAGNLNYQMLKPNTKYLIVFESSQNILSIHFMRGDGLDAIALSLAPVQNNKAIITTRSQIVANEQVLYVNFRAEPNTKVSFKNPMIIEYVEGMENWDIPYIEGMTSCKMPILCTNGKNLLNLSSDTLERLTINGSTGVIVEGNTRCTTKYIKATPKDDLFLKRFNTDYQVAVRYYYNDMLVNRTLNGNGNFISDGNLKVDSNDYYNQIRLIFAKNNNSEVTPQEVSSQQIMLTSSQDDIFEPYKTSILSLPEEVVLRSLPNGVCDTFNMRTSVYTQRVYETTITGTEDWVQYDASNTNRQETIAFSANLGLGEIFDNEETYSKLGGIVCDKLNHISSVWGTNKDIEGISSDQRNVIVQIKKTRLASEDVAGFKTWLTSNNLKVGIQLKVPTITKINLSSTLKSWNTTTHIYSEIPENTLYPILSHSNPTYPVILKPSTKYSIVANSYSNGHTNSAINFNLGGATASTTVGNRVTTITTPSTLSNELLTMSGRGNKLNNVMVIEGDVVGDEPYFEGMCDSKSPILSNVGKNLFNINGEINEKFSNMLANVAPNTVDGNTIIVSSWTGNHHGKGQKIKVKRGELYTCSFTTSDNGNIIIHTPNVLNFIPVKSSTFTFTAPTDCDEIVVAFNTYGTSSGGKIHNLCVVEGDATSVEYEPYKSNTTTFEQKDDKTIVLRSLPNGVCDTLNVETGEYVQRIGEYRVTGGEEETYYTDGETQYIYISNTSALMRMKDTSALVCDKFPYNKNYSTYDYPKVSSTSVLIFVLPTSATGLSTKEEREAYIKNLAKTEGITVQYELATPIVTTIDIQGFPYAYKDGHVQLSSGHSGQSLTPKVEYSLVANRNGQIEANTKSIRRHQDKLDDFEALMLTQMIQTHYEKTLLQFDFEMQMMALGGE